MIAQPLAFCLVPPWQSLQLEICGRRIVLGSCQRSRQLALHSGAATTYTGFSKSPFLQLNSPNACFSPGQPAIMARKLPWKRVSETQQEPASSPQRVLPKLETPRRTAATPSSASAARHRPAALAALNSSGTSSPASIENGVPLRQASRSIAQPFYISSPRAAPGKVRRIPTRVLAAISPLFSLLCCCCCPFGVISELGARLTVTCQVHATRR